MEIIYLNGKMFTIEDWMFKLKLSNGQILVFGYVYNCIKVNNWNPKDISSAFLAKQMGKHQQNISTCLNDLCRLGLLTHKGNASNNCSMYSLTPKVFEISKDVPVIYKNTNIDYSEQVSQVMKKFRAVLGLDVYPIEVIEQYSVPLLAAGQTVDNLCAVIECKAKEWRDDSKMCQFIRPQTLFGNKYDQYLQQSKIMLKDAESNNIDVSFIHKVYDHLGLTAPDDLTDWCIKTLKENTDMNVTALGWTIQSIYLDLKENQKINDEWLQKKMGSTNVLSKVLPAHKKTGIIVGSKLGENLRNMRT